MTNFDLRIHIRLTTNALGRDPGSIKFPRNKAGLKSMLADLRAEQRALAPGFSPEMIKAHKISNA